MPLLADWSPQRVKTGGAIVSMAQPLDLMRGPLVLHGMPRRPAARGGEPPDRPPRSWPRGSAGGRRALGNDALQVAPAGDAELAVDAPQVRLDGLPGHEQRLGDLRVAAARGRQLGHPPLRGRELIPAAPRRIAR